MAKVSSLKSMSTLASCHVLLDSIENANQSLTEKILRFLEEGVYSAVTEDLLECLLRLYPEKVTDSVLKATTPHHLREFKVERCLPMLSFFGLTEVMKKCKHLHKISLKECNQLMSPGQFILWKRMGVNITALCLESCNNVTDQVVQSALRHIPTLRHLNVSCCENLTETVFLLNGDSQKEKTFCPTLENTGHYECSLVSVDVSGCSGITTNAVHHLTALTGPTLKHVNLSYTSINLVAILSLAGYSLPALIDLVISFYNKSKIKTGSKNEELFKSLVDLKTTLDHFYTEHSFKHQAGAKERTKTESEENKNNTGSEKTCEKGQLKDSSLTTENSESSSSADNSMQQQECTLENSIIQDDFIQLENVKLDFEGTETNNEKLYDKMSNISLVNGLKGLDLNGDLCTTETHCLQNEEENVCNITTNGGAHSQCQNCNVPKVDDTKEGDFCVDIKATKDSQSGHRHDDRIYAKTQRNMNKDEENPCLEFIHAKLECKTAVEFNCCCQDENSNHDNSTNSGAFEIMSESRCFNTEEEKICLENQNDKILTDYLFENSDDKTSLSSKTVSNSDTLNCDFAQSDVKCPNTSACSMDEKLNQDLDVYLSQCLPSCKDNMTEWNGASLDVLEGENGHITQPICVDTAKQYDKPKTQIDISLGYNMYEHQCQQEISAINASRDNQKHSLIDSDSGLSAHANSLVNPSGCCCVNDCDSFKNKKILDGDIDIEDGGACSENVDLCTCQNDRTENITIDKEKTEYITDKCQNLDQHGFIERNKKRIVQAYKPQLISIDITNNFPLVHEFSVGFECLKEFLQCVPDLQKLAISWAGLTDEMIQELAPFLKELRELSLTDCEQVTYGIAHISQNCKNLVKVDFNGIHFIKDIFLRPFLQNPNLESLYLAETYITDGTLFRIAAKCIDRFQELDLSWCDELTTQGLNALCRKQSPIKLLYFRHCPATNQTLSLMAENFRQLQSLNLCSVDNITDPAVVYLVESLPMLTDVDISWNSGLTDVSIHALLRSCIYLKKAVLSGLKSLSSDPFLPIISDLDKFRRCQALLRSKFCVGKVLSDHEEGCSSEEEEEEICVPYRSTTYAPNLQVLELEYCDCVDDDQLSEIVTVCRSSLVIKGYYSEVIKPVMIFSTRGNSFLPHIGPIVIHDENGDEAMPYFNCKEIH